MIKYKKVLVIRGECGAFFAGYEGDRYIMRQKRDALHFSYVSQAVQAFPRYGKWEVVEYKKPITRGSSKQEDK